MSHSPNSSRRGRSQSAPRRTDPATRMSSCTLRPMLQVYSPTLVVPENSIRRDSRSEADLKPPHRRDALFPSCSPSRRKSPCNLAGVIRVARDFVQVGTHRAPAPCQGDRRLSVKQRSQLPLQRPDGGGQRRLRDAAAAGCAGEIELFAQRYKVTDLVHLQWLSSPVR
jgi:hypothetical protein